MTDLDFGQYMSMSIEHNDHKNVYEKLSDYLAAMTKNNELTQEEYDRCIKTDELWEIRIYPNTPISFHYVCAPTLEEAIIKMKSERDKK